MPPITDPAILEQIKRQQEQLTGGAGIPPAPPPPDPYYQPAPQPFPGARAPSRLPIGMNPRQVSAEHKQDVMLPSQVSNSESEAELKKLQLRDARMKAGLDPDTGKKLANSGVVGNDALADLNEGQKDIVKGITQGRVPISSLAMARNPELYKLVQRAFQYEPGTDLTTFNRRQAAFQKFMSNPNSPMVRVNQALQHLDRFATNAKELGNAHSNVFTNPLNLDNYAHAGYMAMSKDPKYTAFVTDRDALATELAAAFQGGGQSALADRDHWKSILSAANSPEAFDQVVQEAIGLLGGRVEASNAQFKQAVGAQADFYDLMSPGARKVYKKYVPDAPPDDHEDKEISTTHKTVKIPEGYQMDHQSMLAHHTPGTLTVGQYVQIRKSLDEKYHDELGGANSSLNPAEVEKFVHDYNKGNKISKIPALNVKLSGAEKSNAELAASPLGTATANFANATTFGGVDLVVGQEGRDNMHLMDAAHPVAAMVGEVAGSLAPMKMLDKGGLKLLEKVAPNLKPTARKKLFGDAIVNAVYGGERGATGANEGQGAEGALKGIVGGAVGTGIGTVATKGFTPLLSEATGNALAKMSGVKMTTLQKLGLGKFEEGLSGVPLVHGARKKSLESFNIDNVNQALKYIGEKLPKGTAPGTEANAFMNTRLNAAYNTLRPQIVGATDGQFVTGIAAIKAGAATKEKKAMYSEINDALKKFTDPTTGHYDGQGYKEASERLRYLSKTWANQAESQGSVAAGDMARAAEQARKQMQTLVQRQTPEVGQKLKAVERAWAHSVRIEDASNRALAASEAVYSPGQLLTSIKKLDTSARKGASARGKAFGQDYAEAAAKTLGSSGAPKVSIRETAYVLTGLGLGGYTAPAAVPVVSAMVAGAYGPGVKRIVQTILSGKRPTPIDNQIVRRILEDASRHKMTGN